jgi:hypothetical protein
VRKTVAARPDDPLLQHGRESCGNLAPGQVSGVRRGVRPALLLARSRRIELEAGIDAVDLVAELERDALPPDRLRLRGRLRLAEAGQSFVRREEVLS